MPYYKKPNGEVIFVGFNQPLPIDQGLMHHAYSAHEEALGWKNPPAQAGAMVGVNPAAEIAVDMAVAEMPQVNLQFADPFLNKAKKPLKAKVEVKMAEVVDPEKATIAQTYGCATRELGEATQFMGGLECEVEGVPKGKHIGHGLFQYKEDGSLRNMGAEYVSLPARRSVLIEEFKALHAWLQLDPSKDPFSHRTSIHVHVNAASLTQKQAKNMLLLYALFEEFWFSMVKPERRANIHCVPLTETHLPTYYHKDIHYLRSRWSKYSALNLCRLSDLGTFEFRHHHGTDDVEAVDIWLKCLDNLWTLSRQVVIDVDALSNPDRIYAWFSTIFQSSPRTMMLAPQLMNIIGNSLIDVKFSTIKE